MNILPEQFRRGSKTIEQEEKGCGYCAVGRRPPRPTHENESKGVWFGETWIPSGRLSGIGSSSEFGTRLITLWLTFDKEADRPQFDVVTAQLEQVGFGVRFSDHGIEFATVEVHWRTMPWAFDDTKVEIEIRLMLEHMDAALGALKTAYPYAQITPSPISAANDVVAQWLMAEQAHPRPEPMQKAVGDDVANQGDC